MTSNIPNCRHGKLWGEDCLECKKEMPKKDKGELREWRKEYGIIWNSDEREVYLVSISEILKGKNTFDIKISLDEFVTKYIAQQKQEIVNEIQIRIGQCKQPVGYSCEYCSALNDALKIVKNS